MGFDMLLHSYKGLRYRRNLRTTRLPPNLAEPHAQEMLDDAQVRSAWMMKLSMQMPKPSIADFGGPEIYGLSKRYAVLGKQ